MQVARFPYDTQHCKVTLDAETELASAMPMLCNDEYTTIEREDDGEASTPPGNE